MMSWMTFLLLVSDATATSCLVPGVGHLLPLEEGAVVPVDFVPTVLTSGGCRDTDEGPLEVRLVEVASGALAAEARLETIPSLRTVALPVPATLLVGAAYRLEATSAEESWERTFTVGETAAAEHGIPTVDEARAWVHRIDEGFEHIGDLEVIAGEAPEGFGYLEVAAAEELGLVLEVAPIEEGSVYLSPVETRDRRADRLCWMLTQVDGAGRRGETVDVCTDDIEHERLGCSSAGAGGLVLGWLGLAPLLGLRRRR